MEDCGHSQYKAKLKELLRYLKYNSFKEYLKKCDHMPTSSTYCGKQVYHRYDHILSIRSISGKWIKIDSTKTEVFAVHLEKIVEPIAPIHPYFHI